MSKLRVFLADDHPIVREGLKTLVNAQIDMHVVGEASDGLTTHRLVCALQPDVVILDVSMPEGNGVQITAALIQSYPNMRVLALSVHEDSGYLRRLLGSGAVGYVLKRSAADILLQAVRAVAAGEIFVDPLIAGKVVDRYVNGLIAGSTSAGDLSDREADVLSMIAQGYSNKEIALRLNVSVKTIETYKTRATEKLGLNSRVAIVRYALQQGWLQGP